MHSRDLESEFGGGDCSTTEITLGELGLLCPDALFHTRREKSGGDVLLVSEAKPRFICGDSRAGWEKSPASTPADGVFAIIPPVSASLPPRL